MDYNEFQEALSYSMIYLDAKFHSEFPNNQSICKVINYVRGICGQQYLSKECIIETILHVIANEDKSVLYTWKNFMPCISNTQLQCLIDRHFIDEMLLLFEETYIIVNHLLDLVSRYRSTQIIVTTYHNRDNKNNYSASQKSDKHNNFISNLSLCKHT